MGEERELENTFKIINEKGEEVVCDILFTFDSDETKKSYIVYTDNSKDENGNIESEQEWKVIETILDTLQEEIKKKLDEASSNEGNTDEQ